MSWKHTFGTKTFEGFMRRLFRDSNLQTEYPCNFFNKKIVVAMDKIRNAEITLDDRGYHEHYSGVEVTIINKITGKIASEWFRFADYMKKPEDPTDKSNLHVWGSAGDGTIDWYCNGATPVSIANFTDNVRKYISLYA